ncbi:MAG: acetoacetate--CoA ligase [Pseudomonadota bacterium]
MSTDAHDLAIKPLWTPTQQQVDATLISEFEKALADVGIGPFDNYGDLHAWSCDNLNGFWQHFWSFARMQGEAGSIAHQYDPSIKSANFFPHSKMNFAQEMLRNADDRTAIVFVGEDGRRIETSRSQLRDLVSRIASAMRSAGIAPGDRVAAFVPNCMETIAAMLATQAIGAIWSSCSPDFGPAGVEDRFGQIEPKMLFTADGYFYSGKTIDSRPALAEIAERLPSVERIVVFPYALEGAEVDQITGAETLEHFIATHPAQQIDYELRSVRDPGFILFSSGTTGKPKCIIHSAGGLLLQHMKEQMLHCNVRPGDNLFYFTTCGWMMWNWLVSGLAVEATLILFDGNPFHPGAERLFELIEAEGITHFGTSAKAIDHAQKSGVVPQDLGSFPTLRAILSTGSPLKHESFDYVYDSWKNDVHLASISGGTDICACFIGGVPTLPVWRGEIQAPMLAVAAQVFGENGSPISGEPGELVCTSPHPSMPVGFLNDADGSRYHAAYFDIFDNVWCHGDWLTRTDHGGFVVAGRSDATLNPGGVRIGTAEIYRQVERIEDVAEAVVVGQDWDGDTRVVLFVRLQPGAELTDSLTKRIRTEIRTNASPRHVPSIIAEVTDIPRTKSGKIVELAVRDVIHSRKVRNLTSLANPEALQQFADRSELAR